MKQNYDFDRVVDRRGTDSVKWEVAENELPMWVADMDFTAEPGILEAIRKRAAQGILGYTSIPEEWYKAYGDWWGRRHQFYLEKESLLFCTGVIPAIASVFRRLIAPGQSVVIQPPVYPAFYPCVRQQGLEVLENPLIFEDGAYRVDFEDLERKFADPKTAVFLLCNPHNPIGKLWDRETLGRMGELAKQYGVLVVSDEIHCDVTRPGTEYVPFASVSDICRENSITCIAPTKTFNLAGLKTAAAYVPDPALRKKADQAFRADGLDDPNVFAPMGAVAAFTGGEAWRDAMCAYVYENRRIVEEYLAENLPRISVTGGDATYLLWLQLGAVTKDSLAFCRKLRERTGLFISDGASFGTGGESCARMNIACPKSLVEDGLRRLKEGIEG